MLELPGGLCVLPPLATHVTGADYYDADVKLDVTGAGGGVTTGPAQLPRLVLDALTGRSVALWKALGCRGTARVDFLVTTHAEERKGGSHEVLALEVNTTPGMSIDSNFVAAAKLAGLSHSDTVLAFLHEALTRPPYDGPLPVPAITRPPLDGAAARPSCRTPDRGSLVSRIHPVPMCRQRIEPEEWHRHGGDQLGDRMEWSNRACGMASLRMILLSYGIDAPPLTELVLLGVKADALTDRGWLHAGIAGLSTAFGLPAQAEPVDAADLLTRLYDAPLIMSVTEQFPDDGRRGGHLVVARGHRPALDGTDLLIRDLSAWGQDHPAVPLPRATASYSGRAITFPPRS